MSDPTLEEYLADIDGLDPEIEANQNIPNRADEQAGRALREIATLRSRHESNAAYAERERAKINGWEQQVNKPLEDRIAWLYSLLDKYAINERLLDETRKTITTPYGVLKTQPAQPKWEIVDEDVFIKWAEANAPDLVNVTKKPKLAELKKQFKAEDGKAVDVVLGTVADGVTVTVPARKFTATITPTK